MRKPRFRFNVLTMMILVALMASGFFCNNMLHRRQEHLASAADHASRAAYWASLGERNPHPDRETEDLRKQIGSETSQQRRDALAHFLDGSLKNRESRNLRWKAKVAAQRANAEFYRHLERLDLFAARYPWLPKAKKPPRPSLNVEGGARSQTSVAR